MLCLKVFRGDYPDVRIKSRTYLTDAQVLVDKTRPVLSAK